jgi:hypothetical protein
MHSVVRRTVRLRALRPITRRLLRVYNRTKGRSQIAFDFADPETERLFWEQSAERERREQGR